MKSGTFEYFGDGSWLKPLPSREREPMMPRVRAKGRGLLRRSKRGLTGHGARGHLGAMFSGWMGSPREETAPAKAAPDTRYADLSAAWNALFGARQAREADARLAGLSRYFYC
jgi:hypothetical protein